VLERLRGRGRLGVDKERKGGVDKERKGGEDKERKEVRTRNARR
jgi:hypothetical protein